MFALGDIVEWESQSQANWKKKQGVIIEVVEPLVMPTKYHPNGGPMGLPRLSESYVVRVGKSRTYWPRVSQLNKKYVEDKEK